MEVPYFNVNKTFFTTTSVTLYNFPSTIFVTDRPSALWTACDNGNLELVDALLTIDGISDEVAAPDGTSAADIALGHRNADIFVKLLESGIEPQGRIIFLARELLKVEDGDAKTEAFKGAVRRSLTSMGIPTTETSAEDVTGAEGAGLARELCALLQF